MSPLVTLGLSSDTSYSQKAEIRVSARSDSARVWRHKLTPVAVARSGERSLPLVATTIKSPSPTLVMEGRRLP